MNLLAIDTSTEFLSLAACRDESVREIHVPAAQRHAELILGAIDTLLGETGLAIGDIEGLAYGSGPGSFTGLRIACGVAQGLALARGIRVCGVSSLLTLAEESGASKVVSCLDARMGEVYHAAYRKSGGAWIELHAPGLYKPDAVPVLEGKDWCGCGSGFAAFGDALMARLGQAVNSVRPDLVPKASAVLSLSRREFERGAGKDPAEALPVYLRDKVALKTSER